MVEVQEPIIVDREKAFVPDEISFINFVLSNYDNPVAPEPKDYAVIEFEKTTKAQNIRMRAKLSVEASKKGLTGKEKGAYINLEVDKFKLERKNERDQVIEKRTKELATEIPDGLNKLKKLSPLLTTIDDGILMHDFTIKILDVLPENVHLLATEADAKMIIKHVRIGGEEEFKEKIFYEEAENDFERIQWLSQPYFNVPEKLLPLIKTSFQFQSKGIQDELLLLLEERIENSQMRKDPTFANYTAILDEFLKTAKKNTKTNYLQVQCFSCHGYHNAGFQEVPSNEYDPETKGYVMIPVEKLTR